MPLYKGRIAGGSMIRALQSVIYQDRLGAQHARLRAEMKQDKQRARHQKKSEVALERLLQANLKGPRSQAA
jgi:hypothetical protein